MAVGKQVNESRKFKRKQSLDVLLLLLHPTNEVFPNQADVDVGFMMANDGSAKGVSSVNFLLGAVFRLGSFSDVIIDIFVLSLVAENHVASFGVRNQRASYM